MYDIVIVVIVLLLSVTGGASLLYYRRVKRASRRYEEAKGVVDDVVLSFNRELRKQENRLNVVAYETEEVASQSEETVRRVKEYEGQLMEIITKMKTTSKGDRRISAQFEDVNKRIDDISTQQKTVMQKIEEVERDRHKLTVTPEAKIEAAIPIMRESALAPLTRTELSVLEILATEGRKITSEIKERVELTREHTARLMKKLYTAGYLERDVHKIPYAYRIKEEMRRILRKEPKT